MARRSKKYRNTSISAASRDTVTPQGSGVSLFNNNVDMLSLGRSSMASSGASVNDRSALTVSTVYACVNVICGALASMPFKIYENNKGIRGEVEHPLHWIFNESFSPAWSAATAWEFLTLSRLFHGDAFAKIVRPNTLSNKVVHILPLHPDAVEVTRAKNGALLYRYRDGKETTIIEQSDMLHVTGMGFNGLRSMSTIKHALKNVVGAALATDEYSASFFKNNARPDFVLSTSDQLNPETVQSLRDQFGQRHQGIGNNHLPAVLQQGLEIKTLSMTAEDAQLIATRNFQVEDICRVFCVPPFMIGHTQNTSSWGTGVEQMGLGFVKYTLQRHINAFEQEINRKLWPQSTDLVGKFDTAGLERGDRKTRFEANRIALGRAGEPGFLTPNEIRRIENYPPITGGDTLITGISTDGTEPK